MKVALSTINQTNKQTNQYINHSYMYQTEIENHNTNIYKSNVVKKCKFVGLNFRGVLIVVIICGFFNSWAYNFQN